MKLQIDFDTVTDFNDVKNLLKILLADKRFNSAWDSECDKEEFKKYFKKIQ